MTTKNIVWLASYPKSGNTWTRAFLFNYLVNAEVAAPINKLHQLGIGDAITKSYRMVGIPLFDPSDPKQVLNRRPAVLRAIAGNEADLNFVKSHNVNGKAFDQKLIPEALTKSAVYIIRNPLDMLISFARHYGNGPGEAIETIGREDHVVNGDANSVVQFVGNWSTHVSSWVNEKSFPVHVMRYEDMLDDPNGTFGAMLKFIGFPVDEDRLDRAIDHSSFKELSKQEEKSGFVERSAKTERFFHTGQSGQWKSVLTEEQVNELRRQHGAVMKQFGYL